MAILFVSGVNDLSKLGVTLDDKGQIGHLMDGNCSVQHRLPLNERVAAGTVIFGKGVKQRGIDFKKEPSLIFNQIADADTHRGALERCAELCSQVSSTVINHPEHVLETSRDHVSSVLQGIPGVIMPQTRRFRPRSPDEVFEYAAAEGFNFPFIVRVAGMHAGQSMVRVETCDNFAEMHALPFDGRDFYLTQFVDYKSKDGLYRKTRIAVVDSMPLIRHHLIDSNWKVHASSLSFMDKHTSLTDEANSLLADFDRTLGPAVKARVTEIAKRLGLEYFGIDCNINEQGEMLIFEANANMNILYNSRKEYQECVDVIKKFILQMIDGRSSQTIR